jgi:hypothetical protein
LIDGIIAEGTQPAPKPDDPAQSKRFIATAEEVAADGDEAAKSMLDDPRICPSKAFLKSNRMVGLDERNTASLNRLIR